MYSALPRLVAAVEMVALAILLCAGMALGQNSQPDSEHFESPDPFAGWHATLSSAADKALASALADGPWMKTPDVSVGASGPIAQTSVERLEHLRAGVERVQHIRPTIEPILRQEAVPAELSAIVLVESGGQPAALSPKGARGVWQLMPETARRYGLVVGPGNDERVDVLKSTRAAARYLRDLHDRFASWPLALAAYNAGEDVVRRALTRTGASDFAELGRALPAETRAYVPAVMAAAQSFGAHIALHGPAFPGPGADSIVFSGGYEDDEHRGDEIIYTGHGGRDPNTGQGVGVLWAFAR